MDGISGTIVNDDISGLDFETPCSRTKHPHPAEFMLSCKHCDWQQYVCRKHAVKHRIYIEGFLVLDKKHHIVCEGCGWKSRDWDGILRIDAIA